MPLLDELLTMRAGFFGESQGEFLSMRESFLFSNVEPSS